MNAAEITERMRLMLDVAIALSACQITRAQADEILALARP